MPSTSKIDIAMTAVLRPALLSETLNKIKAHVCKGNTERYRLIINVDPIGENVPSKRVIKTARNVFENITFNLPDTPSFPKAVKWVWSQVETPYFFHWEDDIDILYDIDVDHMISILKKYKNLSSLRLFREKTPKRKVLSTFGCKWGLKPEGFYLADDWKRQFGLNPILIKKEFIDEALPLMKDDLNPEKQFRVFQPFMKPIIEKWKYGLYTKPGSPRMIDGRKGERWKRSLGLRKNNLGFTRWSKTAAKPKKKPMKKRKKK